MSEKRVFAGEMQPDAESLANRGRRELLRGMSAGAVLGAVQIQCQTGSNVPGLTPIQLSPMGWWSWNSFSNAVNSANTHPSLTKANTNPPCQFRASPDSRMGKKS
jgi:hypothetical protein